MLGFEGASTAWSFWAQGMVKWRDINVIVIVIVSVMASVTVVSLPLSEDVTSESHIVWQVARVALNVIEWSQRS